MVQSIRILFSASVLLLAAACAPQEPRGDSRHFWPGACVGADWDAIGYRDGVRGLDYAFGARQSECELAPPERAETLYAEGYDRGLWDYCTPSNGYRVGARNLAYYDVCPPDLAAEFLAGYRRGLTDWSLRNFYDGYWFAGIYTPLPIAVLKDRPRDRLRHAPRPHHRHWRDRDGDRDGRRDRDDRARRDDDDAGRPATDRDRPADARPSHDGGVDAYRPHRDRDGWRRGHDRDDSSDARDRDESDDRDGAARPAPSHDRPEASGRAHGDGGRIWYRSDSDDDDDDDRDYDRGNGDSSSYDTDDSSDSDDDDDDDDDEILIAPSGHGSRDD